MFDIIKSIAKHFAVYGIGRIVNRLVGFLLIPVYTRFLQPSDYGTLELIELTGYIAGMFLGGGIVNAIMRFYYDSDDTDSQNTVVSTALLAVLAVSFVFGTALFLAAPTLSQLVFKSQEYVELFQIAFVSLTLTVVTEIPLVFIRVQQRSVLFTVISLVRLVLNLSLNIYFLAVIGWGVKGIIIGGLVARAIAFVPLVWYVIRHTGIHFSMRRVGEMWRYGLPYIPSGLSLYILNFSDRFILQRLTSLTDVGVYSLGYKFGIVIQPLVAEPFRSIWGPKMFEIAGRTDAPQIYARVLTYFVAVMLFVGTGICVLIKDVMYFMAAPEYFSAYLYVPPILLAYIMWGVSATAQIGILIKKKTKYIAIIMAAAAATNLTCNLLLIPHLGLWGAAIATVIAYAVHLSLTILISNRMIRIPYEKMRLFKLFVAAGAVYALSTTLPFELGSPVGLGARMLWCLSFPLFLLLLGFFNASELSRLKSWRQILERRNQ